jgi:dsRNA-specific ribonuclease
MGNEFKFLADTFEAIIAAVFIDSGHDLKVISKMIYDKLNLLA